jgi:sortase (surface protein transpeptidase)
MRAAVLLLAVMAYLVTGGTASAAPAERVTIEKIGVNAPIVSVGARGGTLATGDNLWVGYRWSKGVQPCRPGSWMLAVHSYEVRGGQALGNRLGALTRGDVIGIQRPGKDCRYSVTSNRVQPVGASVSECFSFDGRARGCLVTCTGRVGPGMYTHRRVIRFVRL